LSLQLQSKIKLFWLWDVTETSLTVQDVSFYSSMEEDMMSFEMLCCVDWQVAAKISGEHIPSSGSSSSSSCFTMKMEALNSSEMLVTFHQQ